MEATRTVDKILTLDRIRQEVAVRDALLEKNPIPNSGEVLDVMSIISKRNRNHASSVYSGYSVSGNNSFESHEMIIQ